MLPKAILFDLDDTIISYDGASDLAWEKSCRSFVENNKVSFDAEQLLNKINETRRWYWSDPERHRLGRMNLMEARREIVQATMVGLGLVNRELALKFADDYTKLQEEMIHIFPESKAVLDKLRAMGMRMVLITNGTAEKQWGKIRRFDLADYFELCLVEEDVGFGKPDLRVFEMALTHLGLKAEEVWMVGDNLQWDIEAPQKLGIYAIWNDYRKAGLPKGSKIIPDRIIHSIVELL